jgi:hypothetical protein
MKLFFGSAESCRHSSTRSALRCRTGPNRSGSIRARRANVLASCRSSFRVLLVINSTFLRVRHDDVVSQLR